MKVNQRQSKYKMKKIKFNKSTIYWNYNLNNFSNNIVIIYKNID